MQHPTRVMWEWTVRTRDFAEQLAIARLGGFDILSLPLVNIERQATFGRSAAALAELANEAGVRLDFLDGYAGWLDFPGAANVIGFLREKSPRPPRMALELCRALGLRTIVAIPAFAAQSIPQSAVIDSFARFCELAADSGVRVDLEPMPMLGVPDLTSAWEIVRHSPCADTGIMFDTWHFMRAGADFRALDALPSGRILNLQLADGYRIARGDTLWQDAMHNRLLPGEGEFPLQNIVQAVTARHALATIGPEVLCDEVDTQPAAYVARAAADSVNRLLAGLEV